MALPIEDIVGQYLEAERLVPTGSRVLLAVSGGVDSMAMLHIMHTLHSKGAISGELFVGHVNHQLRAEAADGDEAFVKAEAARLQLRAISIGVDVRGHAAGHKLSIETSARQLRHAALAEMAAELGCIAVATAHHKDDNAETIVHRLLRGTGYRGLAGIRPRRELAPGIAFIRPMLGVSRAQIMDYLESNGIQWREDASNTCIEHTRNFIRHRLLPQLSAEADGRLVDELARLADSCRRLADSVTRQTEAVWSEAATQRGMNRAVFNRCPPAVKIEMIQRCLRAAGCGEQAITADHYAGIIEMAAAMKSGMEFSLPEGAVARFTRDTIEFSLSQSVAAQVLHPCELEVPGETVFGPWRITTRLLARTPDDIHSFRKNKTAFIEWFDMARVAGPLKVRPRREGDRFRPFGSRAEQKIGKFLTATRVSENLREMVAIVEDDKRVIWVAPVRTSEETRVSESTSTILEIAIQKAVDGAK